MFGLFKKSVQFWGLVRLLAWGESDKSGVMGELCRIIRHLGSGMFDLIPLGSLERMRKTRWSARCLGIENKGPFRFNFFTDKTFAQALPVAQKFGDFVFFAWFGLQFNK